MNIVNEVEQAEWAKNATVAMNMIAEKYEIVSAAFTQHLETCRAFSFEIDRRHVSANIIQSRFRIPSQVAAWIAWKLPERFLPSREAVETIIALERM